MTAVGYIGFFVCLSALVLFRKAATRAQHDIAAIFMGLGLAVLAIYLLSVPSC